MLPNMFNHLQARDGAISSPGIPFGLRPNFVHVDKGRVEGIFPCDEAFQGLPGKLQGGIVSALLESAMAHALMAEGIEAIPADMQVCFLLPVELGKEARMNGMLRLRKGPFNHMTACLSQDGQVRATARARYLETLED